MTSAPISMTVRSGFRSSFTPPDVVSTPCRCLLVPPPPALPWLLERRRLGLDLEADDADAAPPLACDASSAILWMCHVLVWFVSVCVSFVNSGATGSSCLGYGGIWIV